MAISSQNQRSGCALCFQTMLQLIRNQYGVVAQFSKNTLLLPTT